MNKPLLKWSPAVPIRKPDNLISSQAAPAFIPSYESEKRENMKFIMSNEYMRIWFQEKSIYERNIYTRQEIIKQESRIKRRIIQRLVTYKKPTKNQNIEDSVERRFLKDDQKRPNMRFKVECPSKSKIKIGEKAGQGMGTSKVAHNTKSHDKAERKVAQKTEDGDEEPTCILECEQEK